MYLWSVSLVYQLSGQFLIFLVDQKKFGRPNKIFESRPCGFGQSLGRPIVQSISPFFWLTKKIFVQSQGIFGQSLIFLVHQVSFWYTKISFQYTKKSEPDKKNSETDQKFPETEQIFFWSTKKSEKQTGQLVDQEIDQNHMDGTKNKIPLLTFDK